MIIHRLFSMFLLQNIYMYCGVGGGGGREVHIRMAWSKQCNLGSYKFFNSHQIRCSYKHKSMNLAICSNI